MIDLPAPNPLEETRAIASARERALRLLTTHPKSRQQLIERLIDKGAPEHIAHAVADELTEQGVLDDLALARAVIESELRSRPAGRRALRAKLARRRIDPAVCDAALHEALADRNELADALAAARHRLRTMPATHDQQTLARRLSDHLARRGFSAHAVRQAVEQTLADPASP